MENIKSIMIDSSVVKEDKAPKKIKTKSADFENILSTKKRLSNELLNMINDAQKVGMASASKVEAIEQPAVTVSDTKEDVSNIKKEESPVVSEPKKEEQPVTEHKYSFEMEPKTEVPKWRETKQTVSTQMPDANSINYSGSADFNLEMACKNADKDSLEHRVYTLGINIINSLKQEKKKLENELENGERDYSDQIKGFELQIEQLTATFNSQLEQLQKRVENAKNDKESYHESMKVKIEDKEKEISAKRNEIKTAGVEAKKADALAKKQKQLAEEQLQIITGIEKFSPELLKPVKITNLNGDIVDQEDNVFSKIRETEEPSTRTM